MFKSKQNKNKFNFGLVSWSLLAGLQVEAEQRVMMVAEGNSTYLECLPRSRHAAVTWYKQAGENSPELNQVHTRFSVILLEFYIHNIDTGWYYVFIKDAGSFQIPSVSAERESRKRLYFCLEPSWHPPNRSSLHFLSLSRSLFPR